MPSRVPTRAAALAATRAWVERAVIGLGLCPFARGAQARGLVRYACSNARDPEALLRDFVAEVRTLLARPAAEIETTLFVHPWALADFDAYNDFLDVADAALDALGATGVLQVASFHPRYRFAGTAADDVANATNRSPYPMLQLLREASVSAAVDAGADGEAIAAANVERLRALGAARWHALMQACAEDARAAVLAAPPGASVLSAPAPAPVLSATPRAPRRARPSPRGRSKPAPR